MLLLARTAVEYYVRVTILGDGSQLFEGTYRQVKFFISSSLDSVCPSPGRLDNSVPRSKRLLTDERSNVLVYMTGNCSFSV